MIAILIIGRVTESIQSVGPPSPLRGSGIRVFADLVSVSRHVPRWAPPERIHSPAGAFRTGWCGRPALCRWGDTRMIRVLPVLLGSPSTGFGCAVAAIAQ